MITFVSSLLYLNPHDESQLEKTIANFVALAEKVRVCVFVSEKYRPLLVPYAHFITLYPFDLYQTWIVSTCIAHAPLELPKSRNGEKDTYEFLLNAHAKHELIESVASLNPYSSTHFAWIDFTAVNLFRQLRATLGYLRMLDSHVIASPCLTLPGCWQALTRETATSIILEGVHWRFCGGYFLGDRDSVLGFCREYRERIVDFLARERTLTWDFNFWAWMEAMGMTLPLRWYSADHNDSLVFCSADLYTQPLNVEKTMQYSYPTLNAPTTFYPTSASYLYSGGKHWLNTRYVNYWIYPSGCYLFHNEKHVIENKNVLSELDDEFQPLNFREVEEYVDLPVHAGSLSEGLEDIRLYDSSPDTQSNGIVKYVATTIGFSPHGKSTIICGEYDLSNAKILNGHLLHSPNFENAQYEKNWIPIGPFRGEENCFIYKWNPLQIGKVNSLGELEIIENYHLPNLIFGKMRGSTCFVETEEGWVGVIHFSEEHRPRHYYHMLLLLEKESLCPLRHTKAFCFEKLGVEFCIGFTVRKDRYVFWISRHDRDPMWMQVPCDELEWKFGL